MKEIRIGLIGAGGQGRAHAKAYNSAKGTFEEDMPIFEYVADTSEELAKFSARKFGFKKWSTDWKDVCNDPDVDLVDINTPNCTHYEIVKYALEKGKHILCEKPLTISAAQSRELATLAKEKGVVNYVGFCNVMNPASAYLRDLVQNGELGEITHVHAAYEQDVIYNPDLPIMWRHIKKIAGSGVTCDLASHALSVTQYVIGDVDEVTAFAKNVVKERPVSRGSKEMQKVETEDMVKFLAKFKNGALGDFTATHSGPGRKNYLYFEIMGTKGTATYNLEHMCDVNVYFTKDEKENGGRDAGFRTVELNPCHGMYNYIQPDGSLAIGFDDLKILQAHAVMAAVRGESYTCDFAMGAKIDGVAEAVLKSLKSQQWEKCE